jgi:hypothetical protein
VSTSDYDSIAATQRSSNKDTIRFGVQHFDIAPFYSKVLLFRRSLRLVRDGDQTRPQSVLALSQRCRVQPEPGSGHRFLKLQSDNLAMHDVFRGRRIKLEYDSSGSSGWIDFRPAAADPCVKRVTCNSHTMHGVTEHLGASFDWQPDKCFQGRVFDELQNLLARIHDCAVVCESPGDRA